MKKFFSVILCCALLIVCIYVPTFAEHEKTVFYLNYGNITIDKNGASGYDKNGTFISENNPLGYIVTQKNPVNPVDKGIVVSGASCEIELLNLNVGRFNEYDCAFEAKDSADVTVTLVGENHLVSGTYRAGLEISLDSKVTINGNGTLYAQSNLQAGIGGGNGQSNGTLVINSGTIYATGGVNGYSTGIGGGTNGSGGNITINGGYVSAVGGQYGAGIGGGFRCGGGNITINGGVITATGGKYGAGIGGGYLTNTDTNIIINGGSVNAVAGTSADNIGNGYKTKIAFSGVHNSDEKTVSPVSVTVDDFKEIYINGIETYPITSAYPDDNKLNIYADATGLIVTEYMPDGSVKFFKVNNKSATQINPYATGSERYEDLLITGDVDSITLTSGFSLIDNTELMYNGVLVDIFTPALRGDINSDGRLNGNDAVVVNCVIAGMLDDKLTVKLSDADGNGTVDNDDMDLLIQYGLQGK